ncbi:hypothetical protein MMC27_004689 [Xylographa pallens]|nr:hypothetical protein [Xylographa pallens]
MQTAPIIVVSSLLVGFVLFAFSMFVYRIFTKRRNHLEQLAPHDLDPKSPTRTFTVMDGKVVPIQETKWASTFNSMHWPTYSTHQRGSKQTERASRNVVSDLETGANNGHERSTDMQPQLYYLQQASDLLGCPVYSPLKPLPRIHEARVKSYKGQHHLEQTQPPKYSYVIKNSRNKGDTVSPLPVQEEFRRSTTTSQPAVQVLLQNDTKGSETIIDKQLSAYSLPRKSRISRSSSGPYHVRTRWASNQTPNTSTTLTNGEMKSGLIPVPLGLLPPIVKDLPLSPIRTPEEKPTPEKRPTTPVRNHLVLQPNSPKPNFDMNVLKAASVSAIPHSAFYPYRFPCSGSRQPRKSYRAILKSTNTPDSLPIETSVECNASIKLEQARKASSSDPEPYSALSRPDPTSGDIGTLPQDEPPRQHKASSTSTQPRLPDSDTTLEALSWLANPSLSTSPESSSSRRHPQQHPTNTPRMSEESARVAHQSFLDPDTPISGSVPDIAPEKHPSPAGPYSPLDMAQAYRMGNARCVSIYSRFATPGSRKALPSPLVRKPSRLSSASSWRNKPLPSPGSNHSGNAASATAQSFVVSPLSSTFNP